MKRLFLLLVIVPYLLAQTADEVAITAEPSHHLALENSEVRAFKVEVAPHSATLLHRHAHDYVFVTLGNANVSNEVAGKPPVEVKLGDGEARFVPGNFAHLAKNLSDQPFRNVTIEFLQDETRRQKPSPWGAEESGVVSFPGGTRRLLFVKDGVRASLVEILAGATVPRHHHNGPHLAVALTDVSLRSDDEGTGPAVVQLKAGEILWVRGDLTHAVTNTGPQPARLVTLEF